MNTTKRSIVVSAILVIALCVSLVAGATFALFTSESSVNITVSSGKIDVVASIDADSIAVGTTLASPSGAEAVLDANGDIALNGIVEGDYVTFNIKVTNNSTVAVKYRTIISCTADNGLFTGLVISIDGAEYTRTIVTGYSDLAVGSGTITVPVKIALPEGAGNAYQGKTCTITYRVEAVQGNADTSVIDTYKYVYTASDLAAALTDPVQHADLGTIVLAQDIDMTTWVPMHLTYRSFVLKGNGHALKNQSQPLATAMGIGTYVIENVKFQNADISRTATIAVERIEGWAAALVAEIHGEGGINLTIDNCDVIDSTIEGYEYAGGLIGFASYGAGSIDISNCDVINSDINTTVSSAGGLIGHTCPITTLTNCTIDADSSVSCAENRAGKGAKAGGLVGTVNKSTTTLTNCTSAATLGNVNAKATLADGCVGRVEAATLIVGGVHYVTHDAFAKLLKQGTTAAGITLEHDYYLVGSSDEEAMFHANNNNAFTWTLDGNGHTIYGLTRPLFSAEANATVIIKDLTISGAHIESTSAQSGRLGTAAFVGKVDGGSNLALTNCKLVDSQVEGKEEDVRTAGLVGYIPAGTVKIKDCVVKDCTIKSVDGAAGIICTTDATTTIDGCKVLGNTSITSTEVRTENANSGILVGSVQSRSVTTIANITVASTVTLAHGGPAPYHNYVGRVITGGTCTIA